jgi:tmRNA-binding protein
MNVNKRQGSSGANRESTKIALPNYVKATTANAEVWLAKGKKIPKESTCIV